MQRSFSLLAVQAPSQRNIGERAAQQFDVPRVPSVHLLAGASDVSDACFVLQARGIFVFLCHTMAEKFFASLQFHFLETSSLFSLLLLSWASRPRDEQNQGSNTSQIKSACVNTSVPKRPTGRLGYACAAETSVYTLWRSVIRWRSVVGSSSLLVAEKKCPILWQRVVSKKKRGNGGVVSKCFVELRCPFRIGNERQSGQAHEEQNTELQSHTLLHLCSLRQ